MREEEVVALAEVCVEGADEGGDRLDHEEEDAVGDGQDETRLLWLCWRHGEGFWLKLRV